MNKHAYISILALSGMVIPYIAAAQQTYTPLAPLPNTTTSSGNALALGDYLAGIFLLAIGVAAVIAVVMLVVAGLEYIGGASSESARKDAKDRIFNAIIGLLIALGSWVVLNAINPALVGGGTSGSGNTFFPPVQVTSSGSGSGSGGAPSNSSTSGNQAAQTSGNWCIVVGQTNSQGTANNTGFVCNSTQQACLQVQSTYPSSSVLQGCYQVP